MKIPFPIQKSAASVLTTGLKFRRAALDASETGVGKTIVACEVVREMGLPFGVICPKAVIPAWNKELAEAGLKPLFVINYDMFKRGYPPYLSRNTKTVKVEKEVNGVKTRESVKVNAKTVTFTVPPGMLLVWDEVHNARGPWTINANMLVAAKDKGLHNLMLSATPFEGPQQMRSIGYALHLHTLFTHTLQPGSKSWEAWMRECGCRPGHFKGTWLPPSKEDLAKLHDTLYNSAVPYAVKLRTTDLPDYFRKNHVYPKSIDFGDDGQIAAYYSRAGIDPEVLAEYVETGDESKLPEGSLTRLLRARQQAEYAKVETFVAMAGSLIEEGKRVAIFVNFDDSVDRIVRDLSTVCTVSVVRGGQTVDERQKNIDAFQDGRARVIVLNAAAGGTGVSLHDTVGDAPRVTLISPSFSLVIFKQVLGRAYRNGMQSDVTQVILLAADTVEEKVYWALKHKLDALETLH